MTHNKIHEELEKMQLKYFTNLVNEQESKIAEQLEQEKKLFDNWDRFKKLNEKKIVLDLIAIAKKSINDDLIISSHFDSYDSFLNDQRFRDYFLTKGIDIGLGIMGGIGRYVLVDKSKYNYFEYYGEKEKLRWNKVALELKKAIEEINKSFEIDKIRRLEDKFFQKAIERNLMDVTQAHIKSIAVELNEKVDGILGQLSVALSVRLKKHWGNNLPKYNKRGITSSRRIDVLSRDGYKCDQCGRTKGETGLHIQHITPESHGGTDEMDNLITLCKDCNLSIGNSKYNPSDKWIKEIGRHIYKRWGKK